MRRRIGIWAITMCVITVCGVVGSILFSKYGKDESTQAVLGTNVVVDGKYYPHITSIPHVSVNVGEWFEYMVELSDLDTDIEAISIYLTEKPQWMYIEENIVRGVPLEEGTYKYVLTVSDGVNSTSSINYVLVQGDEVK